MHEKKTRFVTVLGKHLLLFDSSGTRLNITFKIMLFLTSSGWPLVTHLSEGHAASPHHEPKICYILYMMPTTQTPAAYLQVSEGKFFSSDKEGGFRACLLRSLSDEIR